MNNNYSRRKFLKTVVISAGAAGATGLAGCGGESRNLEQTIIEVTGTDTDGNLFPQSVASGDPRQSSIVLWTRLDAGFSALTVTVQVATDEDFSNIVAQADLTAEFSNDHCVKVKVTDLQNYTRYYYRFIYNSTASKTGRFRTAPKSTDDRDVKFAFVSCQDYTNGYYNTLLKFLEEDNDDLDFIVHLGDYIYETTGDATFQGSVPGRTVNFTNTSGAIDITPSNDADSSLAAATLSQYRDIYKTYRSDEILQQVHEKFPFVIIWDDHEFSDDAWQDVGTYFDGLQDEQNTSRKRNAEKAFFEFQPIDIKPGNGGIASEGQFSEDLDDLYPSVLYRSLRYGRRLNLVMTDYRTYRPDHLIPEDAFPGTVVVGQLQVGQTLYALPNATGAAFKNGVDIGLLGGNEIADITNPTAGEQTALNTAVGAQVASGALPLLAYVDITTVTEPTLQAFITAFNTGLPLLGQQALPVANLQGLLGYALTAAYSNEALFDNPLSQAEAQAKAAGIAIGNIDVASLNATLTSFYSGVRSTLNTSTDFLAQILTGAYQVALAVDAATAGSLATATVGILAVPYTSATLITAISTVLQAPPVSLPLANANAAATGIQAQIQLPYSSNDIMFTALSTALNLPDLDTSGAGSTSLLPASEADGLGDPGWGFQGYGISYALIGKQTLDANNGLGSRYLVVKSTYDLYAAYRTLILGDTAYDDAWGVQQTAAVAVNLAASSATWNVVGTSTSFTSMILDNSVDEDAVPAQPSSLRQALANLINLSGGTADPADPDDDEIPLPATQFYLNVDQWDGFPLRRTVLLENTTDDEGEPLLPASLKSSNAVVIAGDIHASFTTDHGLDTGGNGRCVEFVTPAVSSGNIASFVTTSVAGVLAGDGSVGATEVQGASLITGGFGVWAGLGQAFTDANSQIARAATNVSGVTIIELKQEGGQEVMDVTFHELDTGVIQGAITNLANPAQYANYTTNLVTNQYDTPENLTWSTTTYRVTKTNGVNDSPVVV